eukprot:TRINITY_DN13511_c0_g1_i1.p1 TRINITY_DN13511_c0_g1~~TRINITY_DN13511_c0_g1_i1.p1  ORF type:complete len:180 (+),score=52.13 TRINITY_DN13511_c0_g1_i1:22-540(+)
MSTKRKGAPKKASSSSSSKKFSLTDEQKEDLRKAFDMFDTDQSGQINAQELRDAMQALGFEVEQKEVENMIESVDKDHNGAIEFEEFVEMMTAKMTEKDSKEELQKAFRLFDAEGSGRITLEALRHVALELGEDLKDEELREMIEEADRDKKGYVTEKDFLNLMKKATQYFV